jgi:hypothetical protein
MDAPRRPPAKIEGRKRMQASGLTVAWQGTRSLKDWVAYLENGSEQGGLLLADRVSERSLKSLLARIQNLSRDEVESLGRPVEAVAGQGGGPPLRRPRSGGDSAPTAEIIAPAAAPRRLALGAEAEDRPATAAPTRHRLVGPVAAAARPAERRRAGRVSPRDLAGLVRQLRARVESLEVEHEQMRAELAILRGDADAYEGPPSVFVRGWFRATLVLIVLAIALAVTVPWLMDLFERVSARAPGQTESLALPPNPAAGDR